MLDAIDRLSSTLKSINQVSLSRLRVGDSLQMLDERAKLEDWIGSVHELDGEAEDRILAALQAFHETQFLRGLRQARLVCYGCTQPFGAYPNPNRLIEDRPRFMKLLDFVNKNRHRSRFFRKCFRGLLSAYFSYDPFAADATLVGRENLESLRIFLEDSKAALKTPGFTPSWVAVLDDHPKLLSQDPCRGYSLAAIQGDWTATDELCERLEISDESWFIRRLILAQVGAVLELDDTRYNDCIDEILLLLSNHQFYADAVLSIVLSRHAQCAVQEGSDALRDFAISLWGNPWLASNEHHWKCSRAAREMVTNWLKLHLLHEFFTTLSDTESKNLRRLNFWELYCEDILGMYFALGKEAMVHGNKDYFNFRKNAKGLVVRLADGANDLHALIMQFSRHHVVEFNKRNNVAYFYDTRHGTPTFYFGKGWVDVGALSVGSALKGSNAAPLSKPIRQQDTNELTWEGRYAQALGASENSIRQFCRKYQCQYEDLRPQGGYRWIRPSSLTQCGREAWSVLFGWGFKSAPDKQGYYRAGD